MASELKTAVLVSIFSLVACLPAVSKEIRIVTEEYPPYNFTDPDTGEAAGFSTEIIQALLREVDARGMIEFYPWKRAYHTALNEPYVLIYSIKRTSRREPLFKWVGSLLKTRIVFIVLEKSPVEKTSDILSLKPYTIGAVRGGSTARALTADGFRVEAVAERYQNWEKLKAGRIDVWCTELMSARFTVEARGDSPSLLRTVAVYEKVSGQPLCAAFSRQTPDDVVETFRRGFIRLKSGPAYRSILKKYDPEY